MLRPYETDDNVFRHCQLLQESKAPASEGGRYMCALKRCSKH
jgi:hypothetical protein